MTASKWIGSGLTALLIGGSLVWTLPALADTGFGDSTDSASSNGDSSAQKPPSPSSFDNYDADQRKTDDQVDQDQSAKNDSITIHHVSFDDPFQNEKIQWLNPHGASMSSWSASGTALPGSWSNRGTAVTKFAPNANAPAPLLSLPSPRQHFDAQLTGATAVPKSAQQKLKHLLHAHALAPYRYQYGTVNVRNVAGNPYYHYGSYRSDTPREQASIGYGTLSNAEKEAPTEAP